MVVALNLVARMAINLVAIMVAISSMAISSRMVAISSMAINSMVVVNQMVAHNSIVVVMDHTEMVVPSQEEDVLAGMSHVSHVDNLVTIQINVQIMQVPSQWK